MIDAASRTQVEISRRSRDPCRMSTSEKASLPDAAAAGVTPQTDDAAARAAGATSAGGSAAPAADAAPSPADPLSPAVRRLVRQFDLDITGVHGTGPSGRIRVGDVMGLLGGRKDSGKRDAPLRATTPDGDEHSADDAEQSADSVEQSADDAVFEPAVPATEPQAVAEPAVVAAAPTTTVFDCDLGRVLAHKRKLRRDNVEVLTTSYFLTAFAAAVETAPGLAGGEIPRFGVSLTTKDGRLRSSVVEIPETMPESLEERVRAVDIALRANLHTPLAHSSLLVHHYGESGSLLAAPTPIAAGHVASVGIGRARREVVVRVVDGAEVPRVAARCHVSLSFLADRITLHDANHALAAAVAILESWPE
jgi:pyruvate/2-oxoglutarate dehydrogenase complex dihydrolipoamide acyltransferase (E2) component